MAPLSCAVFVAWLLQGVAAQDGVDRVVEESLAVPPGCVDLDSGHAFKSNDVNSWPCVKVSDNAGTWTNIPRFPNLLGKTLTYTVDLSAVGCRNVLAFQMVDSSHAGGQYCDGQSADPCVEIDFMEANEHVWATTIHSADFPGGWKDGTAKGFGGSRSGLGGYGPHQGSIDTTVPIDVSIGFPTDSNGVLKFFVVSMYQHGSTTPKGQFALGGGNPDGLRRVTEAIKRGMTPGFSYWHTVPAGADWFDKPNCNYWYPGLPAYFYNWKLVEGTEPQPAPTPMPTPTPTPTPMPPPPSPSQAGKCCWGAPGASCSQMGNCQSGWCGESEDHCRGSCKGTWCSNSGMVTWDRLFV